MTEPLDRLKAALADRYAIERELGAGGMATVYLAHDIRHDRQVAVKVLRPDLAAALGPDRFLQEIRIAANLTHPHILPLHDSGDADGFLYYVMPYIEGESLREKLAKEGELPIAEAVRILRDVVDALSHAHKHNVVHRDIKPDNVMLSDRHALVTDFGVAKAVSEATGRHQLTTEGVALGTPAYMSPEQAAADPHIDHRADIYAVGAVAYELLTGRPPFTGNTQQEILAAHVTQAAEPVTKYRESVPPALAQLVMRCLKKKAADRWQSAEELLPQLEALATPSGGVTPTGMIPVAKARSGWKLATATVIALIIAVVLAVTLIPLGGGVSLDPERIVVAVFENATGDPAFDQVGRMAGNFITQGLQSTGVARVVPWQTALQSSRWVESERLAGRVRDPVRALAEETGAGIVIAGAVYLEGDSIQIQAEVSDATQGTLLGSLDPVRGSRESPSETVEFLRQLVMGLLAVRLDERLAAPANLSGDPPPFEAYQAFDEGMDIYIRGGGNRRAQPHFRRASELDPTWAEALLFLVITHGNLSEFAQVDSLLENVGQTDATLTPYHRAYLEYIQAYVDGDNERGLVAIRRAAEMAPGSRAWYNYGWQLRRTNRLQQSVTALSTLDPERGAMRGWMQYWGELTSTYHMLGEHKRELEAARRAERLLPDQPTQALYLQIRALAALGRIEELDELLDELANASDRYWVLRAMVHSPLILRANGHTDAAENASRRATAWFESRPSSETQAAEHRRSYMRALFFAGRVEEAAELCSELVEDYPEEVSSRGLRGYFAAVAGDTAQATRDAEWLVNNDRPYLRGSHTFVLAGIVAALGDHERAMELLRQSYAEGAAHEPSMRWYPPLDPLRGHPEFQEFMRPKG